VARVGLFAVRSSLIPVRTDAHQRCACALGTAAVGGSRYYPSRKKHWHKRNIRKIGTLSFYILYICKFKFWNVINHFLIIFSFSYTYEKFTYREQIS
jgi:hypothetical protein